MVESLVFFGAEGVAKRIAKDGVGFDLGRARWWGGIGIWGCHCWCFYKNCEQTCTLCMLNRESPL